MCMQKILHSFSGCQIFFTNLFTKVYNQARKGRIIHYFPIVFIFNLYTCMYTCHITRIFQWRWWWWKKLEGFCSVRNWINAKAQKSSLTSTWVNEDFALKCKLVMKINEYLFSCSLCCSRKLKCFHGPLQKK